jgi:HAMP domain-containing protein
VIQDERPAGAASSPRTVSLRLRVTAAVMIVLAVMLILLSIAVTAIFIAQSNRNLNALLAGQAQLARQLARSGAGPRQIVNRVQAGGVEAHLVLRNGTEFGPPITSGAAIKTTTITLNAPTRVDGASLTLAVDAALVSEARRTLRRVLMITGVIALAVSAVLVAAAVRVALRPLEEMAGLAKTISQGNRGYQLAPTRTDTELGQTAQAFDEWLDELEGAERRRNKPRNAPGPFWRMRRTSYGPRSPAYRPRPKRCCTTMISSIAMSASTCRHCWYGRPSVPALSSLACLALPVWMPGSILIWRRSRCGHWCTASSIGCGCCILR